jgi:Ca2+-binding RTX toxin-like protein
MEPLQARMFLSVTLIDGVLTVRGTEGDDNIDVMGGSIREPDDTQPERPIGVRFTQHDEQFFPGEQVKQIVIFGGGGNDTITETVWGEHAVTIWGEAGDDQIYTQGKSHIISAGLGDDRIESDGPLKTIDDGPGRDTVLASSQRDVLVGKARLEYRHGTLRITGTEEDDSLRTVQSWEWILGGGAGGPPTRRKRYVYVEFNGVRLNNFPAKRIVAHMGGGNDFVQVPQMNEEAGTTVDGYMAATIFGGGGNDTLIGSTEDDYIAGGDGNDSIFGGDGNDVLLGQKGMDFISGRNGKDMVIGGADHDTLNAGRGTDTIWGDSGSDVIGADARVDVIKQEGISKTGLRQLNGPK